MVHKDTLLKNSPPGSQVERLLWHGTAVDALNNIYAGGFNRSYCGKNGKQQTQCDRRAVLNAFESLRTSYLHGASSHSMKHLEKFALKI